MRGFLAVVRLGLVEALRARLWLAFAGAGVVLMILGLHLAAVDEAARLKLAVVGVTGAMGFVTVLLAILAGAQQVRRDLDARVAFMLFAKPLGRLAYLLGRWTGVMAGLLVGILGMAAVGLVVMALTFERLPQPSSVVLPTSWKQVSPLGELIPIRADGERLFLSSATVGDGVLWQLEGLPAVPPEGLPLLLKGLVRGVDPEAIVDECLVSVEAAPRPGAPSVVLTVAADSPYGTGAQSGQVVLRHRDWSRDDQRQDYVRLVLPPAAVEGGVCQIRLTRLDRRAVVAVARDSSLLVAADGGGLYLNLVRGGLVLLAAAGLLVGVALLVAIVAHLGVALLAGLTMFFAGSLLWTVQEALIYERLSTPVRRLLELSQVLLPDFDRYTVAARLASGQGVPWSVVGSAWLTYGCYTAVLLLLAWLLLARREF